MTHKILYTLALMCLMAGPALAETHPKDYRAEPLAVRADAGAVNTAQTDPLGDVTKLDMTLRFTCPQAGCDKSYFQLMLHADTDETATIQFDAFSDALEGRVTLTDGEAIKSSQPLGLNPRPGDRFEVRIHWTPGNRVTFDLYMTDPATGVRAMESREVQLASPVHHMVMQVSGGELALEKQVYTFR